MEDVCEGRVAAPVDANLGLDTHIIAVTEEALVVERGGELRYLTIEGHEVRVDVVWSSSFTVDRRGRGPMAPPPPAGRKK